MVMTILGPIEREKLGVVAFREHLFSKVPSRSSSATFPLSLNNLASVRADPRCTVHNLHLNAETAENEIRCFQRSGGNTMLELTPHGHSPDFESLRRLAQSRKDFIHIVRGTGVGSMFEDEHIEDQDTITQRLVKDLTSKRAGIIGEVVLSSNRSICEMRCVSCVKAYFAVTGAPILVIPSVPYDMNQIETALAIFEKHHVPSSSIIVAGVYAHLRVEHVDRIEALILRRGYNLCIDVVGLERVVSRELILEPLPSEEEIARVFSSLASRGYGSQLVRSFFVP